MSEVPEVVERVARALDPSAWRGGPLTFGPLRAFRQRFAIEQARVAIAALREPTEAMRYAVWFDQYEFHGGPAAISRELALKRLDDAGQREQDVRSWGAAVDAALGINPKPATPKDQTHE